MFSTKVRWALYQSVSRMRFTSCFIVRIRMICLDCSIQPRVQFQPFRNFICTSYNSTYSPYANKEEKRNENLYLAPAVVKKELHSGGERSCLHVEFDIKGSGIEYNAGDHLLLFPVNRDEVINRLTNLCTINSKDSTEIQKCMAKLKYYLEITSIPTTDLLNKLANFCTNKHEEEKLNLLSSDTVAGKDLYSSWIVNDHRDIIQVLDDLPSCKPPLVNLCKLLPSIKPRYYSISSSPKLYPDSIHITAVVVNFTPTSGRVNKGLTTNWLANLQVDNKIHPTVPIRIVKSQFRLPEAQKTPIIMICQGTGLAPFRSFIQERHFAKKEGKHIGETILYFGCRHKNQDFLYKEELNTYASSDLIKLYTAFSRDQAEKIYVTNLLKQNADEVWDIIENKKGNVYVCGNVNSMAADVHNVIYKIIKEKGKMRDKEAMEYLKEMKSQNRYSTDAWS